MNEIIGITTGDPAGIGPEVVIKALLNLQEHITHHYLIIGNRCVIEKTLEVLNVSFEYEVLKNEKDIDNIESRVSLLELEEFTNLDFEWGRPTEIGGKATVAYILKAIDLALEKKIDAIVTAPISKPALKMAGFSYNGHTELLAEKTNTKKYAMLFVGGNLKVALVTRHSSIKDVPRLLTREKIVNTIRITNAGLQEYFDITKPRIGVSGLNPHLSDEGLFGDEEEKIIKPAVEEAQDKNINCAGPIATDDLFYRASRGEFDAVVSIFHDQALIPIKLLAPDKGVNVTLGLPFIRTSPLHGTAYDIAGKGVANPSSMIEAIKMASKLKMQKALNPF